MKAFKVFAWLLLLTGVCSAQNYEDDPFVEYAADNMSDLYLLCHFDADLDDLGPNDFPVSMVGATASENYDDKGSFHGRNDGGSIICQEGSVVEIEDSTAVGLNDFTICLWAEVTEDLANGGGYNNGAGYRTVGLWRKGNGMAASVRYEIATGNFDCEMVLYQPNDVTCTNSRSVANASLGTSFDVMRPLFYVFRFEAGVSCSTSVYDPEVFPNLVGFGEDTTGVTCFPQTGPDWTVGSSRYWGTTDTEDAGANIDNFAVFDSVSSSVFNNIVFYSLAGNLFIRGDANQDSSIDLSDMSAISTYLSTGSAFDCLDAYNVNGDSSINVADISYLGAYLYSSGPAPASPWPTCGFDFVGLSVTCTEYDDCD